MAAPLQTIAPIVDPVVRAATGGLADSDLAKSVPELVVAVILIGLTLAAVWRIVSKIQEGHAGTVDRFLDHIEKAGEKHEELARAAQGALEANRQTLEKVQASMDRNTEMLGRAAMSLERSNGMLERLEKQVIQTNQKGEK